MFTIAKRFTFAASHTLPADQLPEGHPCARAHGHNYEVEVEMKAPVLTEPGFVKDYRDFKRFGDWLDQTCDHRNLNEVFENTTAEWLAERFFRQAGAMLTDHGAFVSAVRVSETGKTWAEFRL